MQLAHLRLKPAGLRMELRGNRDKLLHHLLWKNPGFFQKSVIFLGLLGKIRVRCFFPGKRESGSKLDLAIRGIHEAISQGTGCDAAALLPVFWWRDSECNSVVSDWNLPLLWLFELLMANTALAPSLPLRELSEYRWLSIRSSTNTKGLVFNSHSHQFT